MNDANDARFMFEQISEAYQVLSDKNSRKEYDQKLDFAKANWSGFRTSTHSSVNQTEEDEEYKPESEKWEYSEFWSNKHEFQNKTYSDFSRFSRTKESEGEINFHSADGKQSVKGSNISILIDLTIQQVVFGTTLEVKYDWDVKCPSWQGTRAHTDQNSKTDYVSWSGCKGTGFTLSKDTYKDVVWTKCNGSGGFSRSKCKVCNHTGLVRKQIHREIVIPSGTNQFIRYPGFGNESSIVQGKSGDLNVKVHIIHNDQFKIEGYNVLTTKSLKIGEAILGGEIKVETLHGEKLILIKEGTQHGDTIVLKSLGIQKVNNIGDLIVKFDIKIPTGLTAQQKELIKKFNELN